jgi:hypothetical protein
MTDSYDDSNENVNLGEDEIPNSITREDVERLKQNWLKDPCWDIEDTEGFENFRDELFEYRKAEEDRWAEKCYREAQTKAANLGVSIETIIQIERLENTVSASTRRASKMLCHALNIEIEEAEGLVDDLVAATIASTKIELLKATATPPTTPEQIGNALATIRSDKFYCSRFSPKAYKSLGLRMDDEELWMSTLSRLMQMGELIPNYELVDPVSEDTVAVYHKVSEIPIGKIFSTEYPFEVSEKQVFLTYSFVKGEENDSQS